MALAALLALTSAAIAAPALGPADPLVAIVGDWQVIDTVAGTTQQDCSKAQTFAISSDAREIVLTEKWAANWTARYRVVRAEPTRVLTIIEDEKRVTDVGDPVLWWLIFEGPDSFRWRRYDWPRTEATSTQWQRCPNAVRP